VVRSGVVQPLNGPRAATRAVVLSAFGVLLFAAFAATPGSPFQPVLPLGEQPSGPFRWLAGVLRFDRLSGTWLIATGVVIAAVAVGAFLLLLREAWHGNVSVRTVVIFTVAANVVVLMQPLLFSRDVYSYAFYGRIAGVYHANPYVRTPVDFAHDVLWPLVGPKWVDTPAVYGPLWTTLSALLARVFRDPVRLVAAFRWIAVVASLATVGVIYDTAKRVWPRRLAFAVVVFGMNPVVLFLSVASGHNDVVMALAVVGAFALLIRGRELPAVAVLSLGVLVKATALVPLVLLIVWCIWRRPPGRRLRAVASHVGLSAAIGLVFAVPYLQTRDPTLGMLEVAGHVGWLAPSIFLQKVVDTISFGTLGWLVRIGFALVLLIAIVAIARDVARRASAGEPRDLGAAIGWSLVLIMLLGPVLLPWYVVWALPMVWLLPKAPRTALIGAGVALALSQWTTEPLRYPDAFGVNLWLGHWLVTPIMTVLLLWVLVDLRRRLAHRLPLEDEQQVSEAAGKG
jgi:alpha-1,6-mannosyltransferase